MGDDSTGLAQKELKYVKGNSPLVQEIWKPSRQLSTLNTSFPERLELASARSAQDLDVEPIEFAAVAVGSEPQAFGTGDIAVMSPRGEWRKIDRGVIGMKNPEIVEQQFELSPDGRTLALGDEFGIVFVTLSNAKSIRIAIRFKDPIIHFWDSDGSGIAITDRSAKIKGTWEVRPNEKKVYSAAYEGRMTSVHSRGRMVELVSAGRGVSLPPTAKGRAFNRLVETAGDGDRNAAPLNYLVPGDASVAQRWSSLLAVVQGDYPAGRRMARGVVAVDVEDADVIGVLALDVPQINWVQALGVLDEKWVIFQVFSGRGGGIFAWDPQSRALKSVTRVDEKAVIISYAWNLLEM